MKSRLEEIEKEAEALREMREVREAQEREAKAIAAVSGPVEEEMETEDKQQLIARLGLGLGMSGLWLELEQLQRPLLHASVSAPALVFIATQGFLGK